MSKHLQKSNTVIAKLNCNFFFLEKRHKFQNMNRNENTLQSKVEDQRELTRLRRIREDREKEVAMCDKRLKCASRDVNSPKHLEFIYGLNLDTRDADGLFIYNCDRLIIMYQPTKQQEKWRNEYRGIVGCVNVPHYVSFEISTPHREIHWWQLHKITIYP